MKKSSILICAVGTAIFVTAAGCRTQTDNPTAVSESFELPQVVETTLPTIDPVLDNATPEPTMSMAYFNEWGHEIGVDGDAVVHTAYGDLCYQEQWASFMKTTETTEGEGVVISFETEINGVTYRLFTITIGAENGTYVGVLTDDAGVSRDVYASVEELELAEDLTDTEAHRLYAMQEDINYVIDTLN